MIYHSTKESISTLIYIPGGCGSPRLRTGKGAQTPGPKGKPQTELAPSELERREARGEAFMHEYPASTAVLMESYS